MAFSIILRDRARTRAAQASKIACWAKHPITHHVEVGASHRQSVEEYDLWLHNASELPVTAVGVLSRVLTPREAKQRYNSDEQSAFKKPLAEIQWFNSSSSLEIDGTYSAVVMPGETATASLLDHVNDSDVGPYMRGWIHFSDASGISWIRDVETGRLMRARPWSTQIRLAGGPRYFLRRFGGPRKEAYKYWLGSAQ